MKKIIILLLMAISIFLFIENVDASELNLDLDLINILDTTEPQAPDLDVSKESQSCKELLGIGLTSIVQLFVKGVKIAAVIIAVVIGMWNFVPPIMSGNPDGELKKAFNKSIKLMIVLVIVVAFPELLNLIGKFFNLDLSCIFG